MSKKRVILITGVARYWGSRLAVQLLSQPGFHVIGLDNEPPKATIKGLDFIQADIRNSLLLELFKSEGIDTLAHLAFIDSGVQSELAFDFNVMGTMKVFGAAAQAGVRKIILRSTTEIYGALPTNSAFLNENHPLKGSLQTGYIRDMVEIEAFCNGFRRQAPEVMLTVMRFPSIVGPTVDSPMTRFLKAPVAPVLLGFDPPMQFIHENDVLEAFIHTVAQDIPGTFNVAAEGVIPLGKLLALTGRFPVPIFHLFAYWTRSAAVSTRINKLMPIELDYIRYPWVADLRHMREELCFTPKYTAEEALREFAGYLRMQPYVTEAANRSFDEERLRDTIDRRNRNRLQNEGFISEPEGEEENGYE
jgi:UDP-glucose 4-epimerase